MCQGDEGVLVYENGQTALTGEALALERMVDGEFLKIAEVSKAQDYLFPIFIPAKELAKIDYFRSFPHLATFPVNLKREDDNLKKFAADGGIDASGDVQLQETAAIQDVMTPSACYHFYLAFRGQNLAAPAYVTTKARCFRREDFYRPLERQWNFLMREIVCIGTQEEVAAFLESHFARLDQLALKLGLKTQWERATDPFFNPTTNPKYVMQKLAPIKKELLWKDGLAIGSINMHHDYFGEAFNIKRNGEPAYSGCVAFGVERWVHALRESQRGHA